jgi:quercetin dioxygenase-like cupin family protein
MIDGLICGNGQQALEWRRAVDRNFVTTEAAMTEPKPIEAFPAQTVHDEGAVGATIRWVITEADGSDNYALRVIELEPQGNTPHHSHWFEHQNYVVEGEGTVTIGDTVYPVKPGDVIFVPGGVPHQYRSAGAAPLKFLCGVPQPWIKEAKEERQKRERG